MKRLYKVLIVSILIFTFVGIIISSFSHTEYPTYGAVTYFDNIGRYQLLYIVNEDYAIKDAENNKFIINFVLYYIQKDSRLYVISNHNKDKLLYSIIDLLTDEIINHTSIKDYNDADQEVFNDTSKMVDLTIKRSYAERHLIELIPQKWRKW